jgi:hypothetical protein
MIIDFCDYVTDNANAIGGALLAIVGVFTSLKKLCKMIMDFLGLDDDTDTDGDPHKG